MTCSKLYVTKIKYNKSLQNQRTKGEIKTSFHFSPILSPILIHIAYAVHTHTQFR